MIFRSIADNADVERLVSLSLKREVSTRWVTGLLERGESRLEWCRMALSADGDPCAAHVDLTSDTDDANLAMRHAFARAGYVKFAVRRDFRWHSP